jgi:Flp pilus assembly protein TadD
MTPPRKPRSSRSEAPSGGGDRASGAGGEPAGAVGGGSLPGSAPAPRPRSAARRGVLDLVICALLAAAVIAVYAQAVSFEFLAYDDPGYVTENAHVQAGLTGEGIDWSLRSGENGNWHPLTWISLMLDVLLLGRGPGGFHAVNVLLHLIATLLLYLVLKRMTGAVGPSAFTAALFALHPAHVESVAWIAERKDVLSALFWFLTLGVYAGYAARPAAGRYVLLIVTFALGLMAKPMLVTLPFVLVLLDVWPLGRLARPDDSAAATRAGLGRLLLEKVPLLALAAASSVVTFLVQRAAGAVLPMERLPLGARLANAGLSYWRYIGKLVWPLHLSPFYRFEADWSSWEIALAWAGLAAATALVLSQVRRLPFLAVGWLWYLGTLVPVIGLVQVGRQAMADRYTYIPSVGLFIMAAWGLAALASTARIPRATIAAAAGIVLVLLSARTFVQARYWKSTVTLFEHAVEENPRNAMAHNMLGSALDEQGRTAEAEQHLRQALALEPGFASAHLSLGLLLAKRGETTEAASHLEQALRTKPNNAPAHKVLGGILGRMGRLEEAGEQFAEAARLDPTDPEARYSLGLTLAARKRYGEAAAEYEGALRLGAKEADVWNSLGFTRQKLGRLDEAMQAYMQALRLRSDYPDARYNLALVLDDLGRTDDALAQLRNLLRIHPGYKDARAALAAIQARGGRAGESAPSAQP